MSEVAFCLGSILPLEPVVELFVSFIGISVDFGYSASDSFSLLISTPSELMNIPTE